MGMEPDDALIGRIFDDKYRIEARLRRGGMGEVYRATHVGTGRTVALKVISRELMHEAEVVERFRREAKAAGCLHHPNVVNVTDFGIASLGEVKLAYLVMEHLEGLTLADLLQKQQRPALGRVVDILEQTCAGVQEAHRCGIVHRDLKPENIWLSTRPHGGYDVKILDFGVARIAGGRAPATGPLRPDEEALLERPVDPEAPTMVEEGPPSPRPLGSTLASVPGPTPSNPGAPAPEQDLTQYGTLLGTPLYMSPEQWLHRGVDARSDVYSLGVIAYQMLAGEVPFTGRSASIAMQHVAEAPVHLEKVAPGVPGPLAAVVMTALAKDPAARPASAQSFAAAIVAGAEGMHSIVRRSVALAATHFPSFVAVNLTVLGPSVAACLLRLVNRLLVSAHVVPEGLGAAIGAVCYGVYLLGVVVLQPVVPALLTPRVRDALLSPLEPPRPPPKLREIVRTLRCTLPATLVIFTAFILLVSVTRAPLLWAAKHAGMFADETADFSAVERMTAVLLEVLPLVLASTLLGRYVAFPSAAVMERLPGLSALRRAAALSRPFRRSAAGVLGLHVSVRFVWWFFALSLGQLASVPFGQMLDTRKDAPVQDAALALSATAVTILSTFTFVMVAVFYLVGRQAEGVTLETSSAPDP